MSGVVGGGSRMLKLGNRDGVPRRSGSWGFGVGTRRIFEKGKLRGRKFVLLLPWKLLPKLRILASNFGLLELHARGRGHSNSKNPR